MAETESESIDSDTENSTMEFDISADGETSEGEMEDEDELAEKDVGGKTLVDQLNGTNAISEKVSTVDSARQRTAKKKHAPKPPAIFLPQMRIFPGSGKSGVKDTSASPVSRRPKSLSISGSLHQEGKRLD